MNNTGGGGPAFSKSPAKGLGPDDVEECRKKCCATDRCVSIVLHELGCFLNDASGTVAPYPRKDTLMAFVNRTTPVG